MAADILEKIVSHKKEQILDSQRRVPPDRLKASAENTDGRRSLYSALQDSSKVHVIAEIKRASPSKGDIRRDLDPALLAAAYEQAGASAVSVLTDNAFFKGSMDDLVSAKNASGLPVLRKDFIISEYQVYEAAASRADAVLLIVRILSGQQLSDLMGLCAKLSLDALVEVHTQSDLETALNAGAVLIGINNRNLASFQTDLSTATAMAASLGPGHIAVAASGISSRKDIEENLAAGISRFLVGESLVRSNSPEALLKKLIHG
ncbi:MAG: indole-3-glycerol phosphate synthase TrpC [Thermodesulfobacteriota bacterium]